MKALLSLGGLPENRQAAAGSGRCYVVQVVAGFIPVAVRVGQTARFARTRRDFS